MKNEFLDSYQQIYVVACGIPYPNRVAGRKHEGHCWACQQEIFDIKGGDDAERERRERREE